MKAGTPPVVGPRIALFTHDTYGLGHVRRSGHILRSLARRHPSAALLLITGSPALQALAPLPPNADYVKIPTLVKTGSTDRRPPHLALPLGELTSLRKRLIKSALEAFRPDLFLVDNFPLGSRKELLPALDRLHERGVPCVLGLRDIVDRPEVVRATWAREGIHAVLRDRYERVLIYGLPEIFDAGVAYGLPDDLRAKLRYCGYVTGVSRNGPRPATTGSRRPVVLATVGGGGDGYPLLAKFVRAMRQLPHVDGLAVTGPLMAEGDRQRLHDLAQAAPGITIETAVSDLPNRMRAADLVVAMGGYNTTAELLALDCFALMVPRNWRYGEYDQGTRAGMEWEQTLRAEAMQRLGLVRVLEPDTLTAGALASAIEDGLARPAQRTSGLDLGGVERVADELTALIGERTDRVKI